MVFKINCFAVNICVFIFINLSNGQNEPTISIVADNEHADFGKPVAIRCTVKDLQISQIYSYSVSYICDSYDNSLVDEVANWIVDDAGIVSFETNETSSSLLGLKIGQGEKGNYPDFDIKLEPAFDKEDIYACYCRLNVFEIPNDVLPIHYYSEFISFYPKLNAQIEYSATPSSFYIGRLFNSQCKLDNFNPSEYIYYEIGFMLNNENNWIAYYEIDVVNNITAFYGNIQIDITGLEVVQGTQTEFPVFDIYLNPLNSKSIGNYYCIVTATKNGSHPHLVSSTRFNAQEAIFPIEAKAIFMIDPKALQANTAFYGQCMVGNFVEEDVQTTYTIRYYYQSDSANESTVIGSYLFVKIDGYFKSRFISTDNNDLKVIDSLSYFPDFNVAMYSSTNPNGHYKCSVQIDNKKEFFSNDFSSNTSRTSNNFKIMLPSIYILIFCLILNFI